MCVTLRPDAAATESEDITCLTPPSHSLTPLSQVLVDIGFSVDGVLAVLLQLDTSNSVYKISSPSQLLEVPKFR